MREIGTLGGSQVMNGKYILKTKDRGFKRIDFSTSIAKILAIVFLFLTSSLSAILVYKSLYQDAITLFLFSVGITSYIYSVILSQINQIQELTKDTIAILRDRADALRQDNELIELLIADTISDIIEPKIRFKLRLFLSTIFDMYALICYYLRHGYFSRAEEFAAIYENMIKSFLEYPYVIDVWLSRDLWGKGCLRDEYDASFVYVIDNLIEEIKKNNPY